jgi:hypothetical protein
MYTPFTPDITGLPPYPLTRKQHTCLDELNSQTAAIVEKGDCFKVRGWAILSALLYPAHREYLTKYFKIQLPTVTSNKGYTQRCDVSLNWALLKNMYPDIPSVLPTDPFDSFFSSPASRLGIWSAYLTAYHKHISAEFQKQNPEVIRTTLLAQLKPGEHLIVLTHSDKEFPKGSYGILGPTPFNPEDLLTEEDDDEYAHWNEQVLTPFDELIVRIAGHTIKRKLKYIIINDDDKEPSLELLGDKSGAAMHTYIHWICGLPAARQVPHWENIIRHHPTGTLIELIGIFKVVYPGISWLQKPTAELGLDSKKPKIKVKYLTYTLDGKKYLLPQLVRSKLDYASPTLMLVPFEAQYGRGKDKVNLDPASYPQLYSR